VLYELHADSVGFSHMYKSIKWQQTARGGIRLGKRVRRKKNRVREYPAWMGRAGWGAQS